MSAPAANALVLRPGADFTPNRLRDIQEMVRRWLDYYAPGIAKLSKQLPKLLGTEALKRHTETVELYTDIGVPEKLAQEVANTVKREMENVFPLEVPLDCEAKFGKDWDAAH